MSSEIKTNNTYEFLEKLNEEKQNLLIKQTIPFASDIKLKNKAYIREM